MVEMIHFVLCVLQKKKKDQNTDIGLFLRRCLTYTQGEKKKSFPLVTEKKMQDKVP